MSADDVPPDVQVRLKGVYHELPEAMRRIADTLMSDSLLGALWGIESMAERANVSIGTVVRFSKRLGYKGFSDFRDALREACQLRSEGDPLEALEAPTDPFWALTEVARRDQDNLNRLLQTLDHATLESATQLLMRLPAQGPPRTRGLPRDVPGPGLQPHAGGPSLHRRHPVRLLQPGGEPRRGRSSSSSSAARRSAGRPSTRRPSRSDPAIPVLAFTDRKDSPLAKSATVTIVLPSEDFLFSFGLSTFSVLSHALAVAVASKDSAGTVRRLKAADEVAQPLFVEHWLPMQPGAIRVARPPKPQPPPRPREP